MKISQMDSVKMLIRMVYLIIISYVHCAFVYFVKYHQYFVIIYLSVIMLRIVIHI